jgi:hypothetical protein
MYATCLFCNTHLGRNDVVAQFPVGKRLAFDPAKGRLWVVCPQCRQWNLTPVEERWEAIEDCERRFRDAKRRVSTGEIGLAKLPGIELIRIGSPMLPELAAWRFGSRLRQRRQRALLIGGAAALVAGGIIVGGISTGIITSVPIVFVWNGRFLARQLQNRRVVARIPDRAGQVLTVRGRGAFNSRFLEGVGTSAWRLDLAHEGGRRILEGPEAVRATGQLLAGVNRFGGNSAEIDKAIEFLEAAKRPDEIFSIMARRQTALAPGIAGLPRTIRLALEMAAHDEAERRAMEGELQELAEAWRRAEEIAAIADNLLLPPSVEAFFRRLA